VIFSTDFLEEHPETVAKFIQAHVDTTRWINENPAEARELVNQGIEEATGAGIPPAVIDAAWENMEVTHDPISSSLFESATSEKELGFIDDDNLEGIYDLALLNQVLSSSGLPEVQVQAP
jgi:NitT/TauT family transport system substrate-binding protein